MTHSSENGQINTLEYLFHPMQTRLYNIEYCITSNDEVQNNEEDCLSPIKKFVLEYPYEAAAAMISSTIEEIKSLVNLIQAKANYINAKATWRTTPDNEKLADMVLAELDGYQNELSFLLEKIAAKHSNIQRFLLDISNEKIETNLNAEELAGLLYFLLIHQKDIIVSNAKKKVCEILSKVVTTSGSSNPNSDNLYNLMYQTPKKKEVIKFWQDKFLSFYNHPVVEKSKK